MGAGVGVVARSSSHVGWAPLPPEAYSRGGFTAAVERNYDIGPAHYNFVRMESFGEPTYVGRILEPERNVTVVKQTVNVTNITYRKVENRTIILQRRAGCRRSGSARESAAALGGKSLGRVQPRRRGARKHFAHEGAFHCSFFEVES